MQWLRWATVAPCHLFLMQSDVVFVNVQMALDIEEETKLTGTAMEGLVSSKRQP